MKEILSSEELINFYDSLPKVHAYHHESTSNENIHQFYKNQKEPDCFNVGDNFDDLDVDEFEGLEEAILEKDILHFRQTLKHVAKTIEPQFTTEEIDAYVNGKLFGDKLVSFEHDLHMNCSLRDVVKLHQDIEMSIGESDIINLRSQISNILQTETSWNVSEKNIEDYIDGILEEELFEEFKLELNDNTDLIAEVNLRKQINEAISENDIFNLRNELIVARQTSEVKKMKMIIPDTKTTNLKFWRSSVAIIIVLIGLAGVLSQNIVSTNHIYNTYFDAPTWSPERSVSNEISLLQEANKSYLNADYAGVAKIIDQMPMSGDENPVFSFYKAASLQNLNNYDGAVESYTKVINHGDNLFIEEAEWYRCLCYLKLENYEKLKMELLAVIQRKGHFENDAKAVIRRLKYSL
jgi:tetratricopeptide (TPR) repeat protein